MATFESLKEAYEQAEQEHRKQRLLEKTRLEAEIEGLQGVLHRAELFERFVVAMSINPTVSTCEPGQVISYAEKITSATLEKIKEFT